ncbi:hypothetical protein GYMLUDRAFT_43647 [Collybiopsis luxurians FD-317 M1]|uniref:DUF4048 domain-containing protein n=1 Tax=Collybiopsis luxurians FD-317 M1 TaxID=944289 RepID=A0A0D0CW72_9AGAR|nr:hypothetical protein GYMLUDRAFT_43647 [Collybiopsis luxurians FD-317 M1]
MTTSGPRPLRLALSAESPTITSSSPITPNSAGPKRNPSFRSNPRRQSSSISYNPPARDHPASPALFSPRHAASPILTPDSPSPESSFRANLSRSASVGSRVSRNVDLRSERSPYASRTGPSTPTTTGLRGNRNSTGSLLNEEKGRPPLTLVEKHAELLHFIAQKESKCLELRTQLAAHEAELLQLKKKWERIVSRGFEKSQSQSGSLPPHSAPPSDSLALSNSTHPPSASIYSAASLSYLDGLSAQAQGAGGAAMLEALGGMKGIRESVQQGVGRLFDAVAGANENGNRRALTHAPSPSSSSTSTYATSSTRLSQSSQSSFRTSISEEEDEDQTSKRKSRKNRPSNIEIVSDTGATPLVSPTRAFAFEDPPRTATPFKSASGGQNETGANIRSRRKSRTFTDEATGVSASEESTGYAESDTNTSESLSTSLVDWGMGLTSPVDSITVNSGLGLSNGGREGNLDKRVSLPTRGSKNGAGGDNGISWVGSMVGKRWEDTISKNQKRASLLLSDVSQSISQSLNPQSIIQALVSPPPTSGAELAPPNGSNRLSASPSSSSLLDEDIPPEESGGVFAPLLEPAVLSPTKSTSSSTIEPQPKSPMKNNITSEARSVGVRIPKTNTARTESSTAPGAIQEDDDDDWNW